MIWTPYDWLNTLYSFYIAAVVSMVSGCGLSFDTCHRNLPNKSWLVLYKLSSCRNSHLKQVKRQRFSYKGECGVHGHTCIEALKRRADLGYR